MNNSDLSKSKAVLSVYGPAWRRPFLTAPAIMKDLAFHNFDIVKPIVSTCIFTLAMKYMVS